MMLVKLIKGGRESESKQEGEGGREIKKVDLVRD
jgi:hypothetical protein